MGEKILSPESSRVLRFLVGVCAPKIIDLLGIRTTDKEAEDFLLNVTKQTLELRETKKIVRHDFMQLLTQLRNGNKLTDDASWEIQTSTEETKTFTINELLGHVFVFFIAGFETTSTASSFAAFELAKNKIIQKRLQSEIDTVLKKYNGEMNYDSLSEMKYLEQVFEESMRLYPPGGLLQRTVTKDYIIPDSNVEIKKGMDIWIPVFGLHRDPKYFKDPLVFEPDRFSPEAKAKITPFSYLPFGDGPRNCIGMRLGILQGKLALAAIFAKYNLELAPNQDPAIKLHPKQGMAPIGGISLKLTPRTI